MVYLTNLLAESLEALKNVANTNKWMMRVTLGFSWTSGLDDTVLIFFLEVACAKCTGLELKEESRPAVFAGRISEHEIRDYSRK